MAIFNILAAADQHLTVDDIYKKASVEYPMLSPATVYRNMEQMVDAYASGPRQAFDEGTTRT
ncbi:MAG: transcriptional repressor [Thermodesulfobacteriota bacterium]